MELDRSADSVEIGPPEIGFGGLQPTTIFQSTVTRPGASRRRCARPPVGHGDLGRRHRLSGAADRQFLLGLAGRKARHRDLQDHLSLAMCLQHEVSAGPARLIIHALSLSRRCRQKVPLAGAGQADLDRAADLVREEIFDPNDVGVPFRSR